MTKLLQEIDTALLEQVKALRQDLHQHPELSWEETRTASVVARELRRAGLDEVIENVAGKGVVGVLRGVRPGKTVALRADMDALPIIEETGLPFASMNHGVMHACGHDGHMAISLGAAHLLAGLRSSLAGQVQWIFQPAEEEGAGAKKMVEAGVLLRPCPVDAIFALHARPEIQPGQIELDALPNAACDAFVIRVIGTGCHGAYPHQGRDPIVMACTLVVTLQQVVSRLVAPFEEAVVTIGSLHAGQRRNIIPGEARMEGTIRTRDPQVRTRVMDEIQRIAAGVVQSLGGRAEITFGESTPRVHNDPALLEMVRKVGTALWGSGQVRQGVSKSMGGEDFSFYLPEQGGVPGCIFRLGVECQKPLHNPGFDFGSEAIKPGILLLSNLVLQFLTET